jgi:hypothetical protein
MSMDAESVVVPLVGRARRAGRKGEEEGRGGRERRKGECETKAEE